MKFKGLVKGITFFYILTNAKGFMQRKKVLFLIGSPNQTTQMHQIASELSDHDCYFSQLYTNNWLNCLVQKVGLLDTTILGGEFRRKGDAYLAEHGLRNDYGAKVYNNKYDMAVFCSDMIITPSLRNLKTVWVQEGMTDPLTNWAKFINRIKFPGYLAMNTSLNGGSNICDVYCAASQGYKEQFGRLGTKPSKIVVTGIPNYDNVRDFLNNDFPYHDYVMVATSDIRETFNKDNREAFLANCVKIADGRQLIFKLHPNEEKERAVAEIRKIAPADALIYTDGNTSHMVANCQELITQYSTVVYIGIALGKKVHSYFDVEKLKSLTPIQTGGKSAAAIAEICRDYLAFGGKKGEYKPPAPKVTDLNSPTLQKVMAE